MTKNQLKEHNQTGRGSKLFLASFNHVESGDLVIALFLSMHVHFALRAVSCFSASEQGLKYLASDPDRAMKYTSTIIVHQAF